MKANQFKQFFKNISSTITHGISIVTHGWCSVANIVGKTVTIILMLPVAIPMNISKAIKSLIDKIAFKFNKTTKAAV